MAEDEKKITKDMPFAKVLELCPETAGVFAEHGMHCLGCAMSHFETIEQGAQAHGIDVDKLLEDLNKKLEESSTKEEKK